MYSHIENNPMRDEIEPFKIGMEVFGKRCFSKAQLYFDEALRRDKTDSTSWLYLGYSLKMTDKV